MRKQLLITILLSLFGVENVLAQDEFTCRDNDNYVINEFAAYATEFDASEQPLIEQIADEVLEQIDTIGGITVIGHSSKFGNTDMQTASELRGENVLDAIMAALEAKASDEHDHVYYAYYGAGTDCPVTSNDTQANRAKNRRAQVFVYSRRSDDEDPEGDDSEDDSNDDVVDNDHDRWIDVLSFSQNESNSSATKCIARKLKKDDSDLAYLSAKAINRVLNMKETKRVGKAVKRATVDMGTSLKSAFEKIVDSVEDMQRTPEQRFLRRLEKSRRSLLAGVNLLDSQANCEDKRIVAMRKFIIKRMQKKRSLYSCKPIKKRVKTMLASIGGKAAGCSAN